MRKPTSVLILAFAVIFSSQSVMATSLDNQDMAFAFGSEGIASEMLALSQQEMEETEGALWPLLARFGRAIWNFVRPAAAPIPRNAAYGATTGSISYAASSIPNDNWTLRGQLGAAGGGATSGVFRNGGFAGIVGAGAGGFVGGQLSSPPSRNNSRNFGRDIGFYCGACRNFRY